MIFRTLAPEELGGWFAHCHSVFASEEAGYFQRHYDLDPWADPSMIFVAMDGETIAATLRVFRREVWLHGRSVRMGGVGEVSTKPAYRRKGLAGDLLEMAITTMQAQDMRVSILFGDQPLYERTGWRFVPVTTVRFAALGEQAQTGSVTIKPFTPEDLPAVMGIYDLYMGRMNGAVIRTPAYWERWVLPQWDPAWVMQAEGQTVGYCSAVVDGELLRVREFATVPQAEDARVAFAGRLAALTGTKTIAGHAAMFPEGIGTQTVYEKAMMIRMNIPPMEGLGDSDALAASMTNAGMCQVDQF